MSNRKLTEYQSLFWDFDGVIKDAVEVKTQAFRKLFQSYGPKVLEKVLCHHKLHGGMSRLVKIPFYFKEYVGFELSDHELQRYLDLFATVSFEEVLKAPWVPGAVNYLQKYAESQNFYIVTGTPQQEIEQLCESLGIRGLFQGIFGAPGNKADWISQTIQKRNLNPRKSAMIGDAYGDYQAALKNQIDFFWRENDAVLHLFENVDCYRIQDFIMVD